MSPEPFHVIHIPIPTTHAAIVATEPFHHDTHIAIATTRTTIVAGRVAASYRDKGGSLTKLRLLLHSGPQCWLSKCNV